MENTYNRKALITFTTCWCLWVSTAGGEMWIMLHLTLPLSFQFANNLSSRRHHYSSSNRRSTFQMLWLSSLNNKSNISHHIDSFTRSKDNTEGSRRENAVLSFYPNDHTHNNRKGGLRSLLLQKLNLEWKRSNNTSWPQGLIRLVSVKFCWTGSGDDLSSRNKNYQTS